MGERKVIEQIIEHLDKSENVALPFGDDVSAIYINHNEVGVLKTDMLVGKTDIPPGMSLRQAARKAVIMNISDFAAKGVKPMAVLVSLGLPDKMTEKEVEEISEGLNKGVREYGTYVIGGDTNEAQDLIICCMVFGISKLKTIMKRSGAKPGDILAVTGPFGKTSAGLKILLEGFGALGSNLNFLDSVYVPRARLNEGLVLSRLGVVSASIDSSDGLAICLHELRKMSHVGFTVTKIPTTEEVIHFAKKNKLDSDDLALYGGEEYELVLTIQPEGMRKAQQSIEKMGSKLVVIGKATENQEIVYYKDNMKKEIYYKGWEHFVNIK
ncbi:MAG: thiamine-phosphate kinase [Candidatus Bathyarchaeota archaeon]